MSSVYLAKLRKACHAPEHRSGRTIWMGLSPAAGRGSGSVLQVLRLEMQARGEGVAGVLAGTSLALLAVLGKHPSLNLNTPAERGGIFDDTWGRPNPILLSVCRRRKVEVGCYAACAATYIRAGSSLSHQIPSESNAHAVFSSKTLNFWRACSTSPCQARSPQRVCVCFFCREDYYFCIFFRIFESFCFQDIRKFRPKNKTSQTAPVKGSAGMIEHVFQCSGSTLERQRGRYDFFAVTAHKIGVAVTVVSV